MISFLLGIPISFMISCFLQRIQYNQVTRVQQIADKGERTNIHAVYQNLITKNAIPRPLKNVAIGAFLCCKGDITGKTRTNKEKNTSLINRINKKGTGQRITEASSIIQYKRKPGQTLPVICCWAEPAYCKLHILIILILFSMTHTTFMHMTQEFQSSSNMLFEKGGPDFAIRVSQFRNTLRVVKMTTGIVLTFEYLRRNAEVNNELHLFR